jgi:Mg-chelatase subunit ChlI
MQAASRPKHGLPSIFAADAWNMLVSELAEGEQLTREGNALMDSLGMTMLMAVARTAVEAAQRRGASAVDREDVQFAYDTILLDRQKPIPARDPSDRHSERMRLIQQFQEENE